jgi:hypothetical protein
MNICKMMNLNIHLIFVGSKENLAAIHLVFSMYLNYIRHLWILIPVPDPKPVVTESLKRCIQ